MEHSLHHLLCSRLLPLPLMLHCIEKLLILVLRIVSITYCAVIFCSLALAVAVGLVPTVVVAVAVLFFFVVGVN